MKDTKRAKETRQARYLKRVDAMLKKDYFNCYFLTFTFTDATLKRTTQRTRERYIKEWLNQQASEFLLNCDYGDLNKREHYHAFIISRYKVIVYDAPQRHNVFIKAKKISATLYNNGKRQNIDKDYRYTITAENLTNHAFKDSTENSKIIYSRSAKKINRHFKALADAKLKAYRESDKGKANKEIYNELTKDQEITLKKRAELERDIHNKYDA